MTDLRTPRQWEYQYGIEVLDADGWTDNAYSQPITRGEFLKRAMASTVEATSGGWYRASALDRVAAELEIDPVVLREAIRRQSLRGIWP
jgi:hypothetical protein